MLERLRQFLRKTGNLYTGTCSFRQSVKGENVKVYYPPLIASLSALDKLKMNSEEVGERRF